VTDGSGPAISVVTPAYQAERWIGETLESILGQTAPPHEVVVVDDGSTDRTGEIAAGFGPPVRVVKQANGGVSAAFNRAVREATGTHLAMCPADDLWEPQKLERQSETLANHPEVDIAFGGARFFGLEERDYPRPAGEGVLDNRAFLREMYRADVVAAPTAVFSRALYDRIGPFREDLAGEDYEYWMRALRHGAVFFYDPRLMTRLRQHGENASAQSVAMWKMNRQVHELYAADVQDDGFARRQLARDLRMIGRAHLGLGEVREARDAYRASLRRSIHPGAALASVVLSLPGAAGPLRRVAARRRARAGASR
jgi:glycosyltransferase involved in cell wall biosynthesis